MTRRILAFLALTTLSVACLAKANGTWLEKVSPADHQRVNPYASHPDAVAAGKNLYATNCAKCHGPDAEGKGSRPALRSERIRTASDGDLAWILKNGQVFKGMPSWAGLPEPERWQLVTYIRSLNTEGPHENQ